MASDTEILLQTRDRVTTITLNRPDRLNAWTGAMGDQVKQAVTAAGRDPDCRVIVITGAGRGFCAGADMERLQSVAEEGAGDAPAHDVDAAAPITAPGPDLGNLYPGLFGYMYDCPKPIIAAINGPIAGIGMAMSLFTDLRFTAEDAIFTTAFAARGLIAEHGMAQLLPRLIGEAQALDLLLSARKFTGAEAAAMGLVNQALPGDQLMPHVTALARTLATQVSPRSMAVMKRQVRKSYAQSFAASLEEADREMLASFDSDDFQEGVNSFVERRPPAFPDL